MRITPNHPRLRIVAVACWVVGCWLLLQSGLLLQAEIAVLPVLMVISATIIFAFGIAFWLLGTDRRAGIVLDPKGIMLNLGHSAAFVDWDNIESVGITKRRMNLLALGSHKQFGLRLHEPELYLQSYEARLPASMSLLGRIVRGMQRILTYYRTFDHAPTVASLEVLRTRTGYDLIIPEALLGGKANEFLDLVDHYRRNHTHRRILHAGNLPASV
ncbi:MAG: hypothetical protein HC822_18460 [Oscillochloris sp.]|nr:hypothetical protein [Oscillochloris sp.]